MTAVAEAEHPATDVIGAMLPIRQRYGLIWHVDQTAAGYFQRILHTFDYNSRAVCVPQGEDASPVVVVFAACGAAAVPLHEGQPRPAGWRYCRNPLCWQQRTAAGER